MEQPTGKAAVATLSILASSLLSACSDQKGFTGQEVEVFAASSFSAVGTELEKAFEAEHEGIELTFNYAGSSKLVQQMNQGASPDLLLTADTRTMDEALTLLEELDGSTTRIIASNTLVLATADQNPAGIKSLADLSGDITLAACAEEVPCGHLAHQALAREGITPAHLSEEQNVSAVSTKIATGAVDAGFIYSTDAQALHKEQNITVFDLPTLPRNDYPLTLTRQGSGTAEAQAFANWLLEPEAQEILQSYGFITAG